MVHDRIELLFILGQIFMSELLFVVSLVIMIQNGKPIGTATGFSIQRMTPYISLQTAT